MTFLKKCNQSSKVIAGASFASFIVAAICGQDEVADAAASVFWVSVAGAVGTWAAEEIQVAVA